MTSPSHAARGLSAYLVERDPATRLAALRTMAAAKERVPVGLARDLVRLDLPVDEKAQILNHVADDSDRDELERLLLDVLREPALSAAAFRAWSQRTDRLLSRDVAALAGAEGITDRTLIALLGGWERLDAHTLFQAVVAAHPVPQAGGRISAMIWDLGAKLARRDEGLLKEAERALLKVTLADHPDAPELMAAVVYVARFAPFQLENLLDGPVRPRTWRDALVSILHATRRDPVSPELRELISRGVPERRGLVAGFAVLWPELWVRPRLMPSDVSAVLTILLAGPLPQDEAVPAAPAITHEAFTGIGSEALMTAIAPLSVETALAAIGLLEPLLEREALEAWMTPKRSALASLAAAPSLRARLSPRLVRWLGTRSAPAPRRADGDEAADRSALVARLYADRAPKPKGRSPWANLHRHLEGEPVPPEVLNAAGRTLLGPFVPVFFDVVAQRGATDEILTTLADYLGTPYQAEQESLVGALAGMNSPHAHAMLFRLLARTDLPVATRVEVCAALRDARSLPSMQGDLRRLLDEMLADPLVRRAEDFTLIDALRSLVIPESARALPAAAADRPSDREALERRAKNLIPGFLRLPDEVKSSLRTAQLVQDALVAADPRAA